MIMYDDGKHDKSEKHWDVTNIFQILSGHKSWIGWNKDFMTAQILTTDLNSARSWFLLLSSNNAGF